MDALEYDRMQRVEDRMWWYRAAHANLLDAYRRARAHPARLLLDAGCGTGGLLGKLAAAGTAERLLGLDVEPRACAVARAKSGAAVAAASVDALPFADASLDAMFSVDVLCHRAVDQDRALAEARRCLAPGGVLVLNLPAYEWLRSAHDERVHTARRYTRGEVEALLRQAGFARVEARYWNSLLFPLMLLRRKLFSASGGESDVMDYPGPIDALFRLATEAERALARAGLRWPFGGSVLAVAVKP